MKTLYLDTSVPSAYFDKLQPLRMDQTIAFWSLALQDYTMVISTVVIDEIQNTPNLERREEMMRLVSQLPVLQETQETQDMAEAFLEANLVPVKKREDALHLALAVEHGFDYLVSWNFSHMINARTQDRLPLLSATRGYWKRPHLVSPQMFVGEQP
jgi:predicted nucleic acid-binding protein